MAIPSTGNVRRAYTEKQWNEMKPHFIKLYKDDKNTLKYTMDQLRQLHGFKATEKMYKTHIKRWGLEKYNKDDELLYLIRLDREHGSIPNRSYTINGRPTTVEDAKRHFRRKKVKSLEDLIAKLPAQMPDTIEIAYEDDEEQLFDFSIPLPDQQEPVPRLILHTGYPASNDAEVMDFDRVTLSPDDINMSAYSPFSAFQSIINSPNLSYQDMDIDDIDPEEQKYYGDSYGAVAIVRQRKPSLIKTPGLEFATHSFLRNMSIFSDMIVNSIRSEPIKYSQAGRFNQLWDLFCTTSTHVRQNRTRQARLVHDEARVTFSRMLTVQDPWLLLSLCLVLNDNLANENKINADSFLNDMSKWTNKSSADHPIVRLVRDLQNTTERTSVQWASYLLEATVRMISERLNEEVGVDHDLSLELSRLHARTLTTVGMHSSAETLLSQDLAMVEDKFGSRSLQNFLRLSALARAHYVAKDYDKALNLYQKIISESTGWADESSLADIKYGAMYFIAKSHAAKGDYIQAAEGAQSALRFALEKQGPEHYWASNARELIAELHIGQRFSELG